jgi:3-oxoadipate enol-lactonase
MPYLNLHGARISYELGGRGATTIVFLHGGLIDSRLWDAQFGWFAQRARVMRYDMPGDGRSEARPEFSGVEDLYEILAALDIERPVLVGLSAGARIALDFAIAYPGLAERLVAVAPGLSGYTDWCFPEPAVEAIRDAIRRGDGERAADAWLALWAPVTGLLLTEFGRANAASLLSDIRLNDIDPPAIGRLGEISTPTLVLVGDKDLPDIRRIADVIATLFRTRASRSWRARIISRTFTIPERSTLASPLSWA